MNISGLSDAGLTDGEARVYLSLLELGTSTTGPIVDRSSIARSIVYQVLERLIEKGLVSYVTKEKTKYYQAAEPKKIIEYMEEKERQLGENKKKVMELLPQLEVQHSEMKKAKVQVYEGFEGMKLVHEKTYERLKRGEEYFYVGVPAFQFPHHHNYWEHDHKRREKAGIKSYLLFEQKTKKSILDNRNSFTGAYARWMNLQQSSPAWVMGYKDMSVIGLPLAKPLTIEIQNKDIAQSFRSYFNAMWKFSKMIYEGDEGIQHLLEEILVEKESYWMGGNSGVESTRLKDWFNEWMQKRVKKKHMMYDLVDYGTHLEGLLPNDIEKHKRKYYQYAELPKELSSPLVTVIFGQRVAQILWNPQMPIAFVLEGQGIVEGYMKYFHYFWKKHR